MLAGLPNCRPRIYDCPTRPETARRAPGRLKCRESNGRSRIHTCRFVKHHASRSPPVITAASLSDSESQPVRRHTAASITHANLLGIAPPVGDDIAFAQPQRQQPQSRSQIDHARRNPHDQTADLLIFQRRKPPSRRRRGVGRIPSRTGKREQGSENAGVNRGGENIQNARSVAGPAIRVE